MTKKILLTISACIFLLVAKATPPEPPIGFRWVLQDEFSDEFDGDQLNSKKWWDYYQPGWEGRAPARFERKAISMGKGKLQIRSGVLDKPKGPYTIYGGAIVSKKYAHYGYYECCFKASKIAMSTTFWMSNDKVPFTEKGDCDNDEYSQELDIQESVGGGTVHQKFRNGMNSNTHYRYIKCGEQKETFISKGAQTKLKSEVSDEYHTYGAWWKSPEEVEFYADNRFFEMVKVSKEISDHPFNRPMHINMVTETYDWQPAPSTQDLENDEINTAYYDWIRGYKLVPVMEQYKQANAPAGLYENSIRVESVSENIFDTNTLEFNYTYANNDNCVLVFSIIEGNKNRKTLQKKNVAALQGYGKGKMEIPLTFTPEEGKNYRLEALLMDAAGNTITDVRYDVSR